MGSHQKKESEGIALLSIYGDEDDDMEDQFHQEESSPRNPEEQENFENGMVLERRITTTSTTAILIKEVRTILSSGSTPNDRSADLIEQQQDQILNENFTSTRVLNSMVSVTPKDSLASPIQEQQRQRESLGIVDYGHDETAMSPEVEDGEIRANAEGMYMEESTMDYGDVHSNQATPGQLSEHENELMIDLVNESKTLEPMEVNMVLVEEGVDRDPLAKFLPPPPMTKCSEELQEKIVKFLNLRKTSGRNYNSEVRNRKEYRNPDFLLHAVTYQDIDQIGCCFNKDVFDPHGYDKSDFYDEIDADMRCETERKKTPKLSIPIPAGNGLNNGSTTVDVVARDGRHNKKSKWDKNPMPASGPGATLLSAANAGG